MIKDWKENVRVVDLHPPEHDCRICGRPCGGGFNVPVYENVIVPDNWTEGWAGFPVCGVCFYLTLAQAMRHPKECIPIGAIEALRGYRSAEEKLVSGILALWEADPHTFSKRPCSTCSAVTKIAGRDFGCVEYANTGIAPWEKK